MQELKQSQNKTVLKLLREHERLTSLEALKNHGIARLAARIENIRKMGIPVETEMVRFISQSGHPGRFAIYYLAKEETAKSCPNPCGPSDWKDGGKCDKNGCYSKMDKPCTQ